MSYTGQNALITTTEYTPQSSDPANPSQGDVFYSDGTARAEGLWTYNGTAWEQVGALSDPALFGLVTGDNTAVSSWDTAGITNCTLGTETTNHLNGKTSFKFTNVTGGLNEFIASPAQTAPKRARGETIGIKFKYTYDGNDDDLTFQLYDKTAANVVTSVTASKSTAAKTATIAGYIPATSSSIELRVVCSVVNNGKILIFDDIQFTDSPFIERSTYNITDWTAYTPLFQGISSTSNREIYYRVVGDSIQIRARFTVDTIVPAGEVQIGLPSTYTVDSTVANATIVGWGDNGTVNLPTGAGYSLLATGGDTYLNLGLAGATSSLVPQNANATLDPGDTISFFAQIQIEGLTSETDQIVHANSGTENVFSARITSADVITSQSSPDNPAIASVLSSSTGLYVITYTSGFFGVIPAVLAVAETNGLNCHITGESTSGCTVNIEDPSGVLTDSDFAIMIQNQGTDYKHPNAYAVVDVNKDQLKLVDGVTAPGTSTGVGQIYIDTSDGDLKVKFGDGTVKTIVTDS